MNESLSLVSEISDTISRPPNGYVLSLYDQLQRDIREFNREIDWRRQQISSHSQGITSARVMLVHAERTLAWMRENQADEILELEAARGRVRAILRQARKTTPPTNNDDDDTGERR